MEAGAKFMRKKCMGSCGAGGGGVCSLSKISVRVANVMVGEGHLPKNTSCLVNILYIEGPGLLSIATPCQPQETPKKNMLQVSKQLPSSLSFHRTGLSQACDDIEFSSL